MKRSPPPRRKKPLARNKKPLSRSGKRLVRRVVQRIKARKVPKRFAKRRDPAYRAWIASLPCALVGHGLGQFCQGPVEATHIRSRGAGGDDLGNLIPLCHAAHQEQHQKGIKWFAEEYFYHPQGSLDELRRIAAEVYPAQYEKAKALGWVPGETL